MKEIIGAFVIADEENPANIEIISIEDSMVIHNHVLYKLLGIIRRRYSK